MANMMDYLDWRGDLTFTASGFNRAERGGGSHACGGIRRVLGAEQQGGDPCAGVNDKGGAVCFGEDGENRAFS